MKKSLENKYFIIMFLLIYLFFPKVSFCKDYKYSNSLDKVIYSFMIDKNHKDNTTQDWMTFGDPSSGILWTSDGLESCRETGDALGNKQFPFCRYGKIIMESQNKPIFTVLKKNIEPLAWDISVRGAHMGAMEVEISPNFISQEINYSIFSKYHGSLSIKKILECGNASGPYNIYIVSAPNKIHAIVVESMSFGSGGGMDSIYLLYDSSEIKKSYISMGGKCHNPD